MDLIQPAPLSFRQTLIEKYFDPDTATPNTHHTAKTTGEAKAKAKAEDEENKDALIRVYLGSHPSSSSLGQGGEKGVYDSLRNFPLGRNMCAELFTPLEIQNIAAGMAIGLAVMHWAATVDGMDVEFVFGGRRRESGLGEGSEKGCDGGERAGIEVEERQGEGKNEDKREEEDKEEGKGDWKSEIQLYILDLDKASPITLTPDSVRGKLVPAFLGNDPYYPRPPTTTTVKVNKEGREKERKRRQ